jgi:hypothetical protein
MIRKGPLPLFLHGLIEYLAGALFIAAPFLFGFDSTAATALAIVVGAGIIVIALVTDSPVGVVRTLPIDVHVVLDYVLAVLLVAAPFIFGFRDDDPAVIFFVVLGVAHLIITTVTGFRARSDTPASESTQ